MWKSWKYYKISKSYENDIYFWLLLKCGKKNIPKGIIRDGSLSQPQTCFGKIYYQCQSRYLIKQILIRHTCLPDVFINLIFNYYMGRD